MFIRVFVLAEKERFELYCNPYSIRDLRKPDNILTTHTIFYIDLLSKSAAAESFFSRN
jgi:hypothetical protein